jgi:hypothetical protein
MAKKKKPPSAESEDWRDDRFYYFAKYTSVCAPYSLTWEEMELEPYENEIEDDAVCCRHYDFQNKREKDAIDSKLSEDFSGYVSKCRRLPGKDARRLL